MYFVNCNESVTNIKNCLDVCLKNDTITYLKRIFNFYYSQKLVLLTKTRYYNKIYGLKTIVNSNLSV